MLFRSHPIVCQFKCLLNFLLFNHAYTFTSFSIFFPILLRAIFILYRTCRLSQNSCSIPKYLPSLSAVSAVISLLPWMTWLTRFGGTLISFYNCVWVMFIGFRNSSNNTLPGVIGDNFFVMVSPLVIINNFYLPGISFVPYKTDTPLIINSNAVFTLSIPL